MKTAMLLAAAMGFAAGMHGVTHQVLGAGAREGSAGGVELGELSVGGARAAVEPAAQNTSVATDLGLGRQSASGSAIVVQGEQFVEKVEVLPPIGFELALDERFNGKTLNRDLWSTHLQVFGRWGDRYHNDSYLNYLSDEDVLVGEGHLRLRADYRNVEGDNPPGVYDYSAGMVSSHDRFAFQYGYIEIRAKFPGGKGAWPCFWLMPQGHHWPPEFDIAEYYAGRKMMHLGLCHGNFPEINWDSDANTDVDFEGSWNTYGLLWLPGKAFWIQNGVVKREARGPHVPAIPMYVILSNGVSSRIGPSGEPDEKTQFPNFFEVEYVKVWRLPELAGP